MSTASNNASEKPEGLSVRVAWDDSAQTTLRYDFEARWSWSDFFTVVQRGYTMLDATPSQHTGVLLYADVPMMRFPPNMLTHLRNLLRKKHPKTKIVVAVTTHSFLRAMLSALFSITGEDGRVLHIAPNVEDARAMIRQRLAQHGQVQEQDSAAGTSDAPDITETS